MLLKCRSVLRHVVFSGGPARFSSAHRGIGVLGVRQFVSSSVCREHGPSASRIDRASVRASTRDVLVHWADGEESKFHQCWLRDCCQSDLSVDQHSKQKKVTSRRAFAPAHGDHEKAVDVSTTSDGGLCIRWADGHVSEYTGDWLRQYDYSSRAKKLRKDHHRRITQYWPCDASRQEDWRQRMLHSFDYRAVCVGGRADAWPWVERLGSTGLSFLSGIPRDDESVVHVANVLGGIHPTMYGHTFDVISENQPTNLAYTSVELPMHMDLMYYESPPGLQILHCLEADVEGGANMFVDGFKVAQDFKEQHPHWFDILCNVPMTFHKPPIEGGVHNMYYKRPLIQLDQEGNVGRLHHSPPWEGPPDCDASLVEALYEARAAFERLVCDEKYHVEKRLSPGEAVVFNNHRVLHYRQKFGPGRRHLRGTYVLMDHFAQTWRVLNDVKDTPPEVRAIVPIGCGGMA